MPATLAVVAFIAAILVIIPLPSHWRVGNVATLSLIVWLFVVDIIYGVNSTVWSANVEVRLVVWCDIATKITIGVSSALPACTMCICKHLEFVASGRAVRLGYKDNRRRMIFEFVMCLGVPVVLMALHYVVQGHRFDIIESVGCQPATYYSIPAVLIVWFPPLLMSTVTLVYAALAVWHFCRARVNFTTYVRDSNSSLTTSRYLRLIAMSITEMLWGTSLTVLAMYDNILPGLRPWLNWDYVHSNFSRIGQYALVQCSAAYLQQLFLFYWAIPASSFIFFLFFGFGEETMKDYRKVYLWLLHRVPKRHGKEVHSSLVSPHTIRPGEITVQITSTLAISDHDKDEALPGYDYSADEKVSSIAHAKLSTGSDGSLASSDIDLDERHKVVLSFLPPVPSVLESEYSLHTFDRRYSAPQSPRYSVSMITPSSIQRRPSSSIAFPVIARTNVDYQRRDIVPGAVRDRAADLV